MTWMVSIVRLSGSGRVAWMDSSLSQKLQMFFVSLSCLHFSSSLKSRSSIQRQRNDRLWIISPSLNCCPCRVHSDSSIWIFQHARWRRLEHPPWWYASVFVAASFNVCIYLWSMHYCCLRVICACLFAQTRGCLGGSTTAAWEQRHVSTQIDAGQEGGGNHRLTVYLNNPTQTSTPLAACQAHRMNLGAPFVFQKHRTGSGEKLSDGWRKRK